MSGAATHPARRRACGDAQRRVRKNAAAAEEENTRIDKMRRMVCTAVRAAIRRFSFYGSLKPFLPFGRTKGRNGVRKRFPRIRCAVDEGRFYSPPAQRQAISQKLFDTSDALNQTATDAAEAARAGKSGLGRFAVDNGMPLGKDVLQSGLDAIVPGLGKTLRAIDLAGGATRDYRYSTGDDYDPDKALARGAFTGSGVALGELAKWGVGKLVPDNLYSDALRRALDAGAYAGGETLGDELGHAWTEAGYETDWGRVGRSGLDAAAFAALDDLIGSAVTSWQNKAQIKSDLEDVKQQYAAALRALTDPHATPEEQARLAQSAIDHADWARYRLDELVPFDAQGKTTEARGALQDIVAEMKPYAAGGAGWFDDPFKLVEAPEWTSEYPYDMIQASGKLGDTDGYSTITSIRYIPVNDKSAADKEINGFRERFQKSDIEHSLVISPRGEVFEVSGLGSVVNTGLVGEDALEGSTIIHNHPVWEGYDKGDSFSVQDIIFAARNRTGIQYLTSGARRDAFVYSGSADENEIRQAYDKAKQVILQEAFDTDSPVEFRQEAIMRILGKYLRGFEFFENL